MKAIIIALLIVSALAVKHQMSNIEKTRYQALRKSGTWGGIMLGLAEMHMLAQGPVDALIQGIEEVLVDLQTKHTEADKNFQVRTDEHNTEIRRLTDLVNEANRQIADTQDTLANVLRPQKAQIEESIADRERFIADTQEYIAEQTNMRELNHAAFLVRVDETQQAFAAIAEAQTILQQLQTGEVSSFTQVKRIQKVMDKVGQKLSKTKGVEKYFIKALVALATSEFADAGAIQRVVDKLNEVNDNLIKTLLLDTNNEELELNTFNTDMAEKSNAIAEAQEQLNALNQQLDETDEAIAAAESFIAQREWDVVQFQAELDSENASYEEATATYNDLVEQFNKEQTACQDALAVVQNATFADYIGGRMEQDKVIDTQHGDGIATGAGTFDFQGEAPRMSM